MSMFKNTAALSLAVLISFGATGCEGSVTIDGNAEPSQSSPSTESTKEAVKSKTENERQETVKTLNELKKISESDAFNAIYDKLNAIDASSPDFIKESQVILDENRELISRINSLVSLTPEALRENQAYFAMSSAGTGIEYPEQFVTDAISLSSIYGLTRSSNNKFESYGMTSDAILKNNAINENSIYLKDQNGAIVNFFDISGFTLGYEDGGKKIILGQENEDGEEKTDLDQLKIDVKNAASTVETWIVHQKGKSVPLIVEDGKIVSGVGNSNAQGKTPEPEFKISDGIELSFEGNSYAYKITGKVKGTDEEVIYDSAKGGLQDQKNAPSKTEIESPSYDFKAFEKFQDEHDSSFDSLEDYVDFLNTEEYASDAKFEVVEKEGTKYVKVEDANSKISEAEVLYTAPVS